MGFDDDHEGKSITLNNGFLLKGVRLGGLRASQDGSRGGGGQNFVVS